MIELGNEHCRHAVERGAAFFLNRSQAGLGVERLRRENKGAAVRQRCQTSHHTTEAMVERHRQADTIIGSVLKLFADEEAIVQDIVVR